MQTTLDRWHVITDLFQLALTHEPDERAVLLNAACADDEALRLEVEALLSSHDRAKSFIDSPAYELGADLLLTHPTSALAGRWGGHYQIIRLLGRGGMGEVYLAEDIALGRQVALKLLREDATRDEHDLARFQREARAASVLNHPNILTVHEIGEACGRHFIATEFIEGITLRQRLVDSRMTVQQAIDIAEQVASALAAAHGAGVVHRDIKPDNIMIRPDGYVKVLDFGLAKLDHRSRTRQARAVSSSALSTPGLVLGTIAYMSPEQARGHDVDARTDVWSFGVMLYEMLAGRAPFEGETSSDCIARILTADPPPLGTGFPDVPPRLDRIVQKALRKERAERYETAAEMLGELRAVGVKRERLTALRHLPSAAMLLIALLLATAGLAYVVSATRNAAPGIHALAVLPFENTGSDAESEYLSDGVTESLINSLARLPNLRVIARTTAFKYKGRATDAREVGQALKVDAILTGRITSRGDALIVQADLIDVEEGSQLWGERYDKTLRDVLDVQQTISTEIAEKIRLRVTGEQKSLLTARQTTNPEAYQHYLRGRFFWNRRSVDGMNRAIEYFNRAIAVDPGYALAYAGLADSYTVLANNSLVPSAEAFRHAKAAATTAVELDGTIAEAHASLGAIAQHEREWATARREYQRAIALNPSYATAHQWYGELLQTLGDVRGGLEAMRRAVALDPLSPVINKEMGEAFYAARRFDEALAQFNEAREMDPNLFTAHVYMGLIDLHKGKYQDALATFRTVGGLPGGEVSAVVFTAYTYSLLGRRDEARASVEQLMAISRQRYVAPVFLAIAHVALGDRGRAFDVLNQACEAGEGVILPNVIKIVPRMEDVRADPRWAALFRCLKLPA